MTCDGCVQTIGNKLNLESEISEVNIDLNSSVMSITADKEFSINELNKIIKNVGDYKINEYKNKNIFVIHDRDIVKGNSNYFENIMSNSYLKNADSLKNLIT